MKMHRFLVRLPAPLFVGLKRRAGEARRSINAILTELLESSIKGDEPGLRQTPVPKLYPALKLIQHSLGAELIGIVLFGSVARGQASASSDIDVLIVLDSAFRIERDLYEELYTAIREAGVGAASLSLHIVNLPKDVSTVDGFLLEITLEGIVLFEKDFLISRFFMQLREMIVAGSFVRESLHGHPYWILPGSAALAGST